MLFDDNQHQNEEEFEIAFAAMREAEEQINEESSKKTGKPVAELLKDEVYSNLLRSKVIEQAARTTGKVLATSTRSLLYLLYLLERDGAYKLNQGEYSNLHEWAQDNLSMDLTGDYTQRLTRAIEVIIMDVHRSMYHDEDGNWIDPAMVIARAPMTALKQSFTIYELATTEERRAIILEMISQKRGAVSRIEAIKKNIAGDNRNPLIAPEFYYRYRGDGKVEVKVVVDSDQLAYIEARLGQDFITNIHFAEVKD